ncbi:hypothetical protein HDU96_001638 [Phlyctochytrium bullatum]|nr:hypothetical protein HDU96_001638 [Phlyctochytrium bullatum]
MELRKVVMAAAAAALATLPFEGTDTSTAEKLFDSFETQNPFINPLASEDVYNLVPQACKPLLMSFTGTYATQEDLSKCFALVKKAPIGQDAYLYVKNHTDLIATLPWLESISKTPFNTSLGKLKEIADQAETVSSNGLRDFVNTMNQALYPAMTPKQIRFFTNILDSRYTMMQPFALGTGEGKGEVKIQGLTPTFLYGSLNLNDGEARKFWNAYASSSADVMSYVGWVVDAINGGNPHDMARSVAEKAQPLDGLQPFIALYLQDETFFDYQHKAGENGTFILEPGFLSHVSAHGLYQLGSYFQNPVTYKLRDPSNNATVVHTFPWIVWPTRGNEANLGRALLMALDLPWPTRTERPYVKTNTTGAAATSTSPAVFTIWVTAAPTSLSPTATTLATPAPSGLIITSAAASSSISRRQADDSTEVPTSVRIPFLQQKARLFYQVDRQTLAIPLFHPRGSNSYYSTYNNSTRAAREELEDYLDYFDRLDASLETAVKSNPNITNVILDLTQWNIPSEALAMAYYFFGSTVKPLEYAFRLTPLVEAILKGFNGSSVSEAAGNAHENYLFPFFNTSHHVPPSTVPSAATFDRTGRPTFPTTNILSQAKTLPVNGSPVRVSGRFVPSTHLAAASFILPRMQRLPRLAAASGRSNGAYFHPANVTILTNAETCVGKCEEFVRIARVQFKVRTVTFGNNPNGVVSSPTPGGYCSQWAFISSLYDDIFIDFFSRYVDAELTRLRQSSSEFTVQSPTPDAVTAAAREVAALLPSGFSLSRFQSGSEAPYKVFLSIPFFLVYDAGAADDAVPLGVANDTEADVTLKDVWAADWPMMMWKMVVKTPAENVATTKPGSNSSVGGGNGTSTATGGKSACAAVRASVGVMVGAVALAAFWML